MADPKYAGLPGIVYDQPDVFETCDLPESEQEYTVNDGDDTSNAVETLHISADEAHSHFKGKVLDGSNVDFSDRISLCHRRGFDARRVEWEVAGEGEEETVTQKYQRLKYEVNHLIEELQAIKGSVPCGDGLVSSVELGKHVEVLHHTLVDLKLEDTLGADIVASISQPQLTLQKKLINLLESFKQTGLVSEKSTSKEKQDGKTSSSDGGNTSVITYELYYAPEHARLNQLANAAMLEKRIDQLESLIGNNPDKLSSLSAWTNHKSVVGAVQVLSARLALLEPAHLDHVEGRLHAVHTRMNSISEKKSAIEDADKQSKVSELYELVKKTEALCSALPEVVNRLVSLEALHEQAMQFSGSLKQLDVAQTRVSAALHSNADLLASVQEKFSQNLDVIHNNVANLDARVQVLQKK
ncbi:dynactin subunit 2-like [Homarus americanus]|uniref:Dynactin subunit 2-like n=1 Tax=Homarus americanus TaxID=6706 RepID=A0A8J5N7A3_HOMAM|nr:dynactin subunit 2-like [Homarus americanus]KAG7174399.1 Dynactin subunit 2-like [Homarus americanus]